MTAWMAVTPHPQRMQRAAWGWVLLGVWGVAALFGPSACTSPPPPGATPPPNDASPDGAVRQFYAALQAQNYTLAYRYLATGATYGEADFGNLQTVTQASFIKLAKARDAEDGKITRLYNLGVGNPTKAGDPIGATAQVWRRYAYHAHLMLKQECGGWKITSIDLL